MVRIEIPEDVEYIIKTLENSGFEAYAVGGCVRDSLLGKEPHDWDVTTSAKPEDMKRIFRRTVDTGIEHGTVTILHDKAAVETTTYRIDGVYEGQDCDMKYLIVDAKYGTAQLSETADGKQMSDNWQDQRLDASVGKEKADEIRMEKLFSPENVGSFVAHIDAEGTVTYDRLDGNGNIAERNVEL